MKTLLLAVLFSGAVLAQSLPIPTDADLAIAGTLNFENQVTLGVTDLVTSVAPSMLAFGWSLLAIIGVYSLLQVSLQGALKQIAAYHVPPMATVTAYIAVLFRIMIASTMMSFYMVPLPGVPFNFHQMFPYLANALSSAITTDLSRQVITQFNQAIHYLPSAGILEVLPAIITVIVLGLISLAEVGMTVITAGSYAVVGLLTLCGPLIIPFYILPSQERRFWSWFDSMLTYSMYVFIATGFIFIFCHPYLDFFANAHGYTVGEWLVRVPYLMLITVVFLWSMFRIPEITHIIFGGAGTVAQGFANSMQGLAVRAIVAAAF